MKKLKSNFAEKNVAIVYRPESPEALNKAREIANWLLQFKVQVYSPSGKKLGAYVKTFAKKNILDRLHLMIVVGGDGTYLRAASFLDGRPVPLLGINMGSLGFLTETRATDAYKAILQFLENKMDLQKRSVAHVEVVQRTKVKKYFFGLNDVVFERGPDTHLIRLGIHFNKNLICELKADGIIIATPTGSTAYNLAAGGPIIYPNSNVFSITPINPHSLTMRPLIVPDHGAIHCRLLSPKASAFLTIDGQRTDEITASDEVIIRKSRRDHLKVREPNSNYFDLLREKLKFGQRD